MSIFGVGGGRSVVVCMFICLSGFYLLFLVRWVGGFLNLFLNLFIPIFTKTL